MKDNKNEEFLSGQLSVLFGRASMDDCIRVANFPQDIVNEILVRCPVRSLLRFKCVCKNWYTLIKTPEFVQQHLKNRSQPQLLVCDIDDDDDDDDDYCTITVISEENPQTFLGMANLIGYVDGLFLMYGEINSAISCALWNPASREVRSFQIPSPMMEDHYPDFGLGIDPLTNDYKVVYFLDNPREYAAVYSCSRDSSRIFKAENISEPPAPYRPEMLRTYGSAYLNGAYYWLLLEHVNFVNIIVFLFDFGSEMFEKIKGPDYHSDGTFTMGMTLLDDSIAVLKKNRSSCHIWVMIQPGVWNKLFTLQCLQQIVSCYGSSLILVTRASRLVSFNVRTNKTMHLGFQHSCLRRDNAFDRWCGVFYYKESLVTIKRREDGELDPCSLNFRVV